MIEGEPSRTAMAVAVRRAEHQLFDRPLVMNDEIAVKLVGGPARGGALAARLPVLRHLRAFLVMRSRFAEDCLARAVAAGVRQYVVLGAGLDTFAYRNPFEAEGLRVFEVDYPATQAWKRRRLAAAGIAVPEPVRYVPVDFDRDRLEEALPAAGFLAGEPAFFSWLGVTPYLTEPVVLAAFRTIFGFGGTSVAFDYARPMETLSGVERLAFGAMSRRVARAGEPFRGFFTPDFLAAALRGIGFREIEAPDTAALNERYFRNRWDGLALRGSAGAVMCAF